MTAQIERGSLLLHSTAPEFDKSSPVYVRTEHYRWICWLTRLPKPRESVRLSGPIFAGKLNLTMFKVFWFDEFQNSKLASNSSNSGELCVRCPSIFIILILALVMTWWIFTLQYNKIFLLYTKKYKTFEKRY